MLRSYVTVKVNCLSFCNNIISNFLHIFIFLIIFLDFIAWKIHMVKPRQSKKSIIYHKSLIPSSLYSKRLKCMVSLCCFLMISPNCQPRVLAIILNDAGSRLTITGIFNYLISSVRFTSLTHTFLSFIYKYKLRNVWNIIFLFNFLVLAIYTIGFFLI